MWNNDCGGMAQSLFKGEDASSIIRGPQVQLNNYFAPSEFQSIEKGGYSLRKPSRNQGTIEADMQYDDINNEGSVQTIEGPDEDNDNIIGGIYTSGNSV